MMKILYEHTMPANVMKEFSNIEGSSENFDVKESSNGSLSLMNRVASGDNMAVMSSTPRIKEDLPSLVPCCEGKELQIKEDIVHSGLSAISMKHDSVMQCLSMSRACERLSVPPGLIKHRNSFRCLHRPDLKRVPYLCRMTPDELEVLFRGYADLPIHAPKLEKVTQSQTVASINNVESCLVQDEVNSLRPIPETNSGAEDVPAGMRLHGARARLYTSVLAGARAGDQLDGISANEEFDTRIADDPIPEDEVQLTEELQIILPPRCDDVSAQSSATTSTDV
ncbi:hypothetical protein ACJJTC_012622 [Scirpophaga incertulas]